MIDDLLRALIRSKNAAADDVLVDALRVGTATEQTVVLAAILARNSIASLAGAIGLYHGLPPVVRSEMVANVRAFHPALREAGRSESESQRLGAIALIADAKQGRLAYILAESLKDPNEAFAKAAADALDTLARDIADSIRALREAPGGHPDDESSLLGVGAPLDEADADNADFTDAPDAGALYRHVLTNRDDVETAIVRGFELHRGSTQQTLLSAALRLCDHAQAQALRVISTSRHVGQSVMIRKVQQTPEPGHVRAFLLAASHGNLRGHFGVAFSKIEQPDVLAALLRQTHWLKDNRLHLCVRQVKQGIWAGNDGGLASDLARRNAADAARVGEWIAASGLDEPSQDAGFARVLDACINDFAARLRLFRTIVASRAREQVITDALKPFLRDPDERLARMAVRELLRRKPHDMENVLLPLMAEAAPSVRTLISRAVGQRGFESFWDKFDHLEPATRRNAGRAMIKLLPDAVGRLARRLTSGTVEQRVKALQITRELDLVGTLKANVLPLCAHANPRVRSKAVVALGDIGLAAVDALIERVASDPDPRVRANAIEVMERRAASDASPAAAPSTINDSQATPPAAGARFVPLLVERGQSGENRERANAIKALHQMKVGVAAGQLLHMLRDPRPDHRVSGLWALRKIGWWRMLAEVARLAREDESLKVRQYAMSVLQQASIAMPNVRAAG